MCKGAIEHFLCEHELLPVVERHQRNKEIVREWINSCVFMSMSTKAGSHLKVYIKRGVLAPESIKLIVELSGEVTYFSLQTHSLYRHGLQHEPCITGKDNMASHEVKKELAESPLPSADSQLCVNLDDTGNVHSRSFMSTGCR
jgi:hypothetical protein